ncbi:hypothetical protein STANM309S_04290 [Streptomyces tanashiensis]
MVDGLGEQRCQQGAAARRPPTARPGPRGRRASRPPPAAGSAPGGARERAPAGEPEHLRLRERPAREPGPQVTGDLGAGARRFRPRAGRGAGACAAPGGGGRARLANPFVLLAALLLVGGAVFGSLVALAAGWLLAYAAG